MNMAGQGMCTTVLKYKGGKECSSDLVGVPIKSTSPESSVLDKFTFCGKYYFRFLTHIFLMGIEPDLILKIRDFENKMGYLIDKGVYYKFNFPNQNVTPDSWQSICLTISSTNIKIVWNGEIILSDPKLDLPTAKMNDTKLWLGGALFSDRDPNRRFEGMIANAYFWNYTLQDVYLISITTKNKFTLSAAKYDLLSNKTSKNSSCINYLNFNENDVLFQGSQPENLLIEYKTDFDSSNYLCKGFGGNLTVPKNEEDMKTLGYVIELSEVCNSPFLGLRKSSNEEILDPKGNLVPYLKWHLKQPNGGESQKCINTWDSYINDEQCDHKHCFFCQVPEKSLFILRGPIPADTERKYFVTIKRNYTEVRGITETECFWNENKWYFGNNLKLENATNNMPPVGLRHWNNGQKLKLTQCKKDEFTCYTYGHCISMNQRCDGHPDCPVDGSDENECKIMTLGKGYDKKHPSVKNNPTFISLYISDITDIDELHMTYTVIFLIQLEWFDSRIVFRNLKPTDYENKLDILEIEKIWSPKLYIRHSINTYVEALRKSQDGSGSVRIHRNGSPKENELAEVDEDYLYPGNENPIIMINYFTIKLGCKFDLKW